MSRSLPRRLIDESGNPQPAWTLWFALIVGFLAAQRFTVPYVSGYVCVVALALALLTWNRPQLRNLFVAIALLAKVDLGNVVYVDTQNFVRFAIYATALAVLASHFRISVGRLSVFLAYVAILIAATLASKVAIDSYSLVRDVLTLLLTLAVLGTDQRSRFPVLRMHVLVWFSIGLLLAEVLNILFFYAAESEEYLSYDSLKCIVAFASLYALVRGRMVLFGVLCAGTIAVLIAYGSRMVLVTYVLSICLVAFSGGVPTRARFSALGFTGVVMLFVVFFATRDFIESHRVFSVLYTLAESEDFREYMRLLDPIRFTEHQLFFDRPIWELLFGSGLGSGFDDSSGLLSFIPFGSGAFSDQELMEGRFYRLHDAWIYLGLRLGIVFICAAYWLFVRSMLSSSRQRVLWGSLGLLMMNSATFSIAGLLMTALVAKQLFMLGGLRRALSRPGPDVHESQR